MLVHLVRLPRASLSSHPNSFASVTLSRPSTVKTLHHISPWLFSFTLMLGCEVLLSKCCREFFLAFVKVLTSCIKAVLSAVWASAKVWSMSKCWNQTPNCFWRSEWALVKVWSISKCWNQSPKCFWRSVVSTGEWAAVKVWWENAVTSHWEILLLTQEFNKMFSLNGT